MVAMRQPLPSVSRRRGRQLSLAPAVFALLTTNAGWFAASCFTGLGRVAGRAGPPIQDVLRRAESGGSAPAEKLWSLVVSRTDHYVWRDKNVFVGIVADAGEWTVDLEAIRSAFDKANEFGFAEVFSAPLYVVKDYMKELRNYGLVAKAEEKTEAKSDGEEEEEEGSWRRRSWKELAPEEKEAAGMSRQEAEGAGGTKCVVIVRNNHPVFEGTRNAEMKFRAYVEIASDAAKRFAPEEGELNACYARIRGDKGRAQVLRRLSPEAAELAQQRLEEAGFVAELEEEEVEIAPA